MKFSWIITSIGVYFALLAFYTLQDEGEFWTDYFYVMIVYGTVVGFASNFKIKKSIKEMVTLSFFLTYKVLLLLYYIIFGMIFNYVEGMMEWLVFIIFFGISSFIGLLYWNKNNEHGV